MAPEVIQNSEGYNEKVSIEAVILSFYFFWYLCHFGVY
jgi:hypothetical protein